MMIRAASRQDCLNLAALSIQVWLDTYAREGVRAVIADYVMSNFTRQQFEQLLQHPGYRTLVCVDDDHLLGYVVVNLESTFERSAHGFEIDTLYVQPQQQGRGVGRQLLAEVVRLYGERFWLSTWIHNEAAIGFYNRLGFAEIGRLDFHLGDERHENLVLGYPGGEVAR